MEYSFITYTKNHTPYNLLRIKDTPPIQNLPLNTTIVHQDTWEDMAIKHIFKVSELIKRDTDEEGFWYAWYKVSEYERIEYDVTMFGLKERKVAHNA